MRLAAYTALDLPLLAEHSKSDSCHDHSWTTAAHVQPIDTRPRNQLFSALLMCKSPSLCSPKALKKTILQLYFFSLQYLEEAPGCWWPLAYPSDLRFLSLVQSCFSSSILETQFCAGDLPLQETQTLVSPLRGQSSRPCVCTAYRRLVRCPHVPRSDGLKQGEHFLSYV